MALTKAVCGLRYAGHGENPCGSRGLTDDDEPIIPGDLVVVLVTHGVENEGTIVDAPVVLPPPCIGARGRKPSNG